MAYGDRTILVEDMIKFENLTKQTTFDKILISLKLIDDTTFEKSGFYYNDEFKYSEELEDFLLNNDIDFTFSTSKYF